MERVTKFALGLALACSLTGCGDKASVPPSSPPTNVVTAGCTASDPGVRSASTFARVDLDGDGNPDTVFLTGPGGKCPGTLFVHLADGYTAVRTDARLTGTGTPVLVPGRSGVLLMDREIHPRGGFQVHVYGMDDHHDLAELLDNGHPVVPFLALDSEQPLTATCAKNALVVTRARPTDPPGVMFAWDVFTTSYAVDGTTVTAGPERKIRTSVPDKVLKKELPDLFRHAMFTHCLGQ